MGDRLLEGLSGDDAAIFSTNTSSSASNGLSSVEDPTGKGLSGTGSWSGVLMPMEAGFKRIKRGATPSGSVPNKTPGAKRVKW